MRNNRKNQIKPKYILVLLVILCVVSMGLSFFKGGSVPSAGVIVSSFMAPMQEGINSIGSFASDLAGKKQDANALEAENEALRNEVDNLKSKLTAMENNLSDYEDLLELLSLSEKYPTYETTGARIIAKDSGNWYSTFTINKGSADGIRKDMNVIAGNGLVGIVTQVNVNSSVVRSIIDDTSNVSGMVSKNRDICIVNGDLTLIDSGLLNVELISKDSTEVDGDEVVTSYISDKYLPGLLIGYISDMTMDDSELTYNAKLTPAVDFQHLSNVHVIMQLKEDMNLSADETDSPSVDETESENVRDTEADGGSQEEQGAGQ